VKPKARSRGRAGDAREWSGPAGSRRPDRRRRHCPPRPSLPGTALRPLFGLRCRTSSR
jgi:hypothetical protein